MVNFGKSMQISTISSSLFGQQINQMWSLHSKRSKPTLRSVGNPLPCHHPFHQVSAHLSRTSWDLTWRLKLVKMASSSESFFGWAWNLSFETTIWPLKRIPSFAKWYCIFHLMLQKVEVLEKTAWTGPQLFDPFGELDNFFGFFKATQNSFLRRLHPCLGVKNTMWVSNRCES